tara:strand:- start:479 stop:958 length:480 start_codon:yes stop_codon:yes gene_type:complete
MQIRIRSTGAVVSEQGFRAMHPNISMPQQLTEATLNDFGADVVFEGPQATGGTVYQYSQRDGVEQVDGKWYTKYILGPVFVDTEDATAAENEAAYKAMKDAEQAASVRADRTKRLADSDWTQLSDAPVTGPAWATHRQALRDITNQAGFPWTITWPDAP